MAATITGDRHRHAAKQAEQERVAQEKQAAEMRQGHLDLLSRREPQAWQEVEALVSKPVSTNYAKAAECLVDLRDLALRQGTSAAFEKRLAKLRAANATRTRFLERLAEAEL